MAAVVCVFVFAGTGTSTRSLVSSATTTRSPRRSKRPKPSSSRNLDRYAQELRLHRLQPDTPEAGADLWSGCRTVPGCLSLIRSTLSLPADQRKLFRFNDRNSLLLLKDTPLLSDRNDPTTRRIRTTPHSPRMLLPVPSGLPGLVVV